MNATLPPSPDAERWKVKEQKLAFYAELKVVGFWCIGGASGVRFAVSRKPRRLTIWLMRLLLEWEWKEGPIL